MRKFTSGMITGGILGIVGMSMALSDKSSRKKIMKKSKRMMSDAADTVDDVKRMVW